MNARSPLSYIIMCAFALTAIGYLAGYFLLYSLKLSPFTATPVTAVSYAYYYWDRAPVRRRIFGSFALSTVLVGALSLIALVPKKRSLHGDARFATMREIKSAGLHAEHGIVLGEHRGRYLILPGQMSVLLAARPRSWKGVSCVIPNLLNWHGSCVVLDPKGENYVKTAGFRSKFNQVFFFNPFSDTTARWNMFDAVRSGAARRFDGVQLIAGMLFPESAAADPFWMRTARSLFMGIALYLFERRDHERALNRDLADEEQKMPEVPVTVGEVLRQGMANDEEGFNERWKRIIQGWSALGKPLSPQCVALIMDTVDLAPQTASSVRKTFTSQLDLWMNPLLDAATSQSDFDFRSLRRKRITLYVGVNPKDFERLQLVMNVFFQQVVAEQMDELPELNPDLKHELLVILDEFTAVGRIPVFQSSIAFVPQYNVRLLIIIQTLSQFDVIYSPAGKEVFYKTIGARIVFAPNDMQDAKGISLELGDTTVPARSRNVPAWFGGKNRSPSVSISDSRRALLLPQEVKLLPEGEELIFVERLRPIRAKKIKYYEDKIFKARLLPAPPLGKLRIENPEGLRSDDHFARWQQVLRQATAPVRRVDRATGEILSPIAALDEFSLDFSTVPVPKGGYLSPDELDTAVKTFLDQLEEA